MDDKVKRTLKSKLYDEFARIGKALGSARRLEILDLLAQAEHSVEHLAEKTGLSIASVSQHLQALRAARLVTVRREGTYAYYSLANEEVLSVWLAISELAQTHLLEIDGLLHRYFEERFTVESISTDELLNRLDDANLLLLDARPHDEFASGHIPGAISLPVDELEAHSDLLSTDKEIVAYCRTSYCLLSDELALALLRQGFNVRKLALGMSGWVSAHLPVEVENSGGPV